MKENEDVILKSDEPFSIKFLASAVCTKGLLCNISGKNLQKNEKSVEILRSSFGSNEWIGLKSPLKKLGQVQAVILCSLMIFATPSRLLSTAFQLAVFQKVHSSTHLRTTGNSLDVCQTLLLLY